MITKILPFIVLVFIALSCKTNKVQDDLNEKVTFNNRVMVTMKDKIIAEDLEKEYEMYALKAKGLASKSANKVLFEFDDSLISNSRMLSILNKNKNVIAAAKLTDANERKTTSGTSQRKGTANPTK